MLHELPVLSHQPLPRGDDTLAPQSTVPDDFGLAHDATRSAADPLTDQFGRRHTYLRISLVERCNLRCQYCMPADGLDWTPSPQLLTDAELVRLARLFVAAGVTKVRLTGGEPLLRTTIQGVAGEIGALPGLKTLAITTNGLLLPKKIDGLQRAGVSLLNISLDTLRADRFEEITRRPGLPLVHRAIDEAISRGYAPVKINCVVMRGVNDDELVDFVRWTEQRPVEVRFIEFMPFDGNRWAGDRLVPFAEMLQRIRAVVPLERLTEGPHETSRAFRVPGYRGTVGFIASMTKPFCEGCNRLRITADGNLKVCLFGNAEVSLRDAMRDGASDAALRALIGNAVGRKHARHAGMDALSAMENRPMITIGG
ncbi:MAG: GTP 3',8-cyclase MoaA [Bacteroidetes bacterium]|jgi:cyclic pyranopterin phosphate synthase|nr:GTP 3',8-cyclase MoaA [Bacteroidota bacterium]